MSEVLLKVEDVYKQYGSKVVLDNVDLVVRKGTLCTIVGPSGCGKSTLLRLILGQEMATSGKIVFEGEPIGYPDTQRGIVYQKYSLFPHLTVLENVMLGKRLVAGLIDGRKQHKLIKSEAEHFLESVRLGGHGHKYPHELSGGMQQRVAIVQALIMKPKILLMDEPFGALDPGTREDMQVFLLELWEETKMTIFFVTHDLEEALYLGTRITVLSQFYADDRGDKTYEHRGAKVVADYDLSPHALSAEAKKSEKFTSLLAQIRKEGFDPEYRAYVKSFNLKHPDSFQTLTGSEHKNSKI